MDAADTSAPEDEVAVGEAGERRGGFGSLGPTIFLLVASWGSYLALLPLGDNSFLTHLATGRLILDRGSVPATDPYSFTAVGARWTVQSWLPSVAYATAERVGGVVGLRLLILAVYLLATVLIWILTRDARSMIPRFLIASAGLVVAAGTWSERPYMIGFIGLALTWLALDGRLRAWVLVPYGWIWANSHGSFPLAVILCAAVIAGSFLDGRSTRSSVFRAEGRVLGALCLGLALGAVSPLGLRGLIFPLRALMDSGKLQLILEWQAPDFTSWPQRTFLILMMLAIASVVATSKWRHAVPLLVFSAMAMLAVRNMVMALPVVLAVISAGAPTIGTLRSASRPALGKPIAVLAASLVLLVTIVGLTEDAFDLGDYPVLGLAWIDQEGLEGRLLAPDATGNLLEALDGEQARVFIDDRADMYPREILNDFITLNRASTGWSDVLADHDIELVIWDGATPFASVLRSDPAWRVEFTDGSWIVAVRRSDRSVP